MHVSILSSQYPNRITLVSYFLLNGKRQVVLKMLTKTNKIFVCKEKIDSWRLKLQMQIVRDNPANTIVRYKRKRFVP